MSAELVGQLFAQAFGGTPTAIASSPGRVNLVGEHTDYNGGEVLPIAIARRTYVAVRVREGDEAHAVSANAPDRRTFSVVEPQREGAWTDYLAGVVGQLTANGIAIPAFDAAVWSDVPAGAGLSSSAALEVATTVALCALVNAELPLPEVAFLGKRVENLFVGVQSGIMDQFASALGRESHALHVWCDSAEYEHVPMRESVLIFDTAVPRELRGSAYNTRREECEAALALLQKLYPGAGALAQLTPEQVAAAALPEPLASRAMHVATETRRVRQAVAAMREGGTVPGELLLASHASLRDLYDCSSPELDWFVERAMQVKGVRGARLTGAGWGGCAIAVGDADALASAAPLIARDYAATFKRDGRTWLTRAADGARVDRGA